MTDRHFDLVESDTHFGRQLAGFLAGQGIRTELHENAGPLLASLALMPPCMVVLGDCQAVETALPTLRSIRDLSRVPCVVLGEGTRTAAAACLLEAGADDLIERDLPLPVMLARMRAVLRRAEWGLPGAAAPESRPWRLLTQRRQLLRPDGSECHLTTAEYALFRLLSEARPHPVPRDTISEKVLQRAYQADARTIDNLVLRLRRRLGPGQEQAIKTLRSAGYMFAGFAGAGFEIG